MPRAVPGRAVPSVSARMVVVDIGKLPRARACRCYLILVPSWSRSTVEDACRVIKGGFRFP